MAVGAIVGGVKKVAKAAAKKAKAAKATPAQAAAYAKRYKALERMDAKNLGPLVMKPNRHLGSNVPGAVAVGGAAAVGQAAKRKRKPAKTADPVASRSRTNRQRDR